MAVGGNPWTWSFAQIGIVGLLLGTSLSQEIRDPRRKLWDETNPRRLLLGMSLSHEIRDPRKNVLGMKSVLGN